MAMHRFLILITCFAIGGNLCESQPVEVGARVGADLLLTKRYNFSTNQYDLEGGGLDILVVHGIFNVQLGDYFVPEARIGFILGDNFTGKEVGLSLKGFLIKERLYGIIGGWLHWNQGAGSIHSPIYAGLFEMLAFGLGFKTSDMESIEILFMKPFEDLGHSTNFSHYDIKPIKFVGLLRVSYGLAWQF